MRGYRAASPATGAILLGGFVTVMLARPGGPSVVNVVDDVGTCIAGLLAVAALGVRAQAVHGDRPAQRADAARAVQAAGGQPPPVTVVLEQVQIDQTVVDLEVVDERYRLPIGRPYVTAAIDVFSRALVGLVVTLEAPSATSVGLCLAHMVTDKRAWLERLGVESAWPMSGKPAEVYVDNAAEFHSEALRRGCD